MESDIISNEFPLNLKILNEYYPFNDLTNNEPPNPIKKLKSCPENIPDTEVDAFPFLANIVMER
jgi:hypothetical protein